MEREDGGIATMTATATPTYQEVPEGVIEANWDQVIIRLII